MALTDSPTSDFRLVFPTSQSGNDRLPATLISTQELAKERFRLGEVRDRIEDRFQTVIHRELNSLPRATFNRRVILR
jgi:hypothetical protein